MSIVQEKIWCLEQQWCLINFPRAHGKGANMPYRRIKHLVLDVPSESLTYYAGLNSTPVYLEPEAGINLFSVILLEGQYSQFASCSSAIGAVAQMEDGRIFGGEIVSSSQDLLKANVSGDIALRLRLEIISNAA
jgi:hypothetical protein